MSTQALRQESNGSGDRPPLVSVLMKSYNHDRFIAEAIESVLQQDFKNLELIIVDDASTDASRQIIERYAQQDPRIRTIFHKQNLGITKVVNDGIDAARGEFIAQIDSDDVWAKDKLRKQLAVLEDNEDSIVWSEGELIDEKGRSLGKTFSQFVPGASKKKSGALFETLLAENVIFGSTLIYKRANLCGLRYDQGLLYLNDYKFLLELARKHEFQHIAEPLAKYRIHGKNTLEGSGPDATRRRRKARAEAIWIRQEALTRYQGEMTDTAKAETYASLGFCYAMLGRLREASSSYLQAIKHNPYACLAYEARFFQGRLQNFLRSRPSQGA